MINAKLMSTLGMARKAGHLIIGQDKVFAGMKLKTQLLVLLSCDSSSNVQKNVAFAAENGRVKMIVMEDIGRTDLGACLGIASAQVVALELSDGFADKILQLYDRGVADE